MLTHEGPSGDQRLVAYVVESSVRADADPHEGPLRLSSEPRPATEQNGDGSRSRELRQYLRTKLPEYMVPNAFLFLEELPLTPNGKVDRKALPAPDSSAPTPGGTFVAPRTPLEQELATMFASVLGVDRVGVHDDFFEIGGHSLLAARLAAEVRATFQISLPLRDLFSQATVETLACAVEEQRENVGRSEGDEEPVRTVVEGLSDGEVDSLLNDLLTPNEKEENR